MSDKYLEAAAKALACDDFGRSIEWIESEIWGKAGTEQDWNEESFRESAIAEYRKSAAEVVKAWVGNRRALYQIGETDLSGTDPTMGQSGLVHPFVDRVMRLLRDEGILVRVEVPE